RATRRVGRPRARPGLPDRRRHRRGGDEDGGARRGPLPGGPCPRGRQVRRRGRRRRAARPPAPRRGRPDRAVDRHEPLGDQRRRDRRRGGDRWRSEVKGILALAVAGFGLVALAAFDPARPPTAQHSPMGPVGVWLAWAAVKSFGYGGFLFPLLLGAWGASA